MINVLIFIIVFAIGWGIFRYFPALFLVIGIIASGYLDYLVILDFIGIFPPETFLQGAELFCLIPFLTFQTLVLTTLFYLAITGQLKKELE